MALAALCLLVFAVMQGTARDVQNALAAGEDGGFGRPGPVLQSQQFGLDPGFDLPGEGPVAGDDGGVALGAAGPGPDFTSGFGRVLLGDTLAFADSGFQLRVDDHREGLVTGSVVTHAYDVAGDSPFRATLVWTDYPAALNAAVAKVGGLKFRGFSAWLVWLVVHLIRLVGFRNRLVVLINWAWDYLFLERASRIIIDR